ncbi:MAG: thioredoxin [bacterium]|nr:thioredoxin [bacterium]
MARELLVLVKHDCDTCGLVLPALDAAILAGERIRILSQSTRAESDALTTRLAIRALDLDTEDEVSERFDPEAVPTLLLLEGDEELDRVEGFDRLRYEELASAADIQLELGHLPASRPGCASRARDPEIDTRLRARRARREGKIRSRSVRVGEIEDIHETLYRRGWTDGLPVVPPTPERVVAMLDHTGRDPREVVGILPPYGGEASVEKVAINAVMAGCPGPALPIVLAALDAVCEESFSLQGVIATTNPMGPLVIVSGPLADRVEMNSGGNCLGQGNRANLGIGRALQLTLRNVGGGRPGRDDRATIGQMGKVGACFAERIDDSPWESLSTERGLAADETGVHVFAAEGPRVISDATSRSASSLAASLGMVVDAMAHPKLRNQLAPLLVLPPSIAKVFGREGWSKARVKQEILERSKRPIADLLPGARGCEVGWDEEPPDDDGSGVPKVASPDEIVIVHAGGEVGSMAMAMAYFPNLERGSPPVLRRAEDWQ